MGLATSQHGLGAPSSFGVARKNFDEENSQILLPLSQRTTQGDDDTNEIKDLAFLKAMSIGFKSVKERYGKRWDKVQEERKSMDLAYQQPKEKVEELRTWYNKRSRDLIRQEEKLAATKEKRLSETAS